MDLTSLMGTLLSGASMQGMGQAAGASTNEVASVLSAALPQLLNGANQQSLNAATATGFNNALATHAQQDTTNVASFFNGIDMNDGAKIVAHLLGAQQAPAQTQQFAQTSGVSAAKTGAILAAAAPLLMSLLGQQTAAAQQQTPTATTSSLMGGLLGSADIGTLAASLLGANMAQQPVQPLQQQTAQPVQQGKPGGLLSILGKLLK